MTGRRDEDGPMEVAQQAAHWFARLLDDAATGDDWLDFETWLAAAPSHQAAYARLEGLWVELDEVADAVAAALDAPVSLDARRAARARPTLSPPAPPRSTLSRRGWLAAGAGLAASVAVGAFTIANWPNSPVETYVTAAGQTRQLTLADGSKVWLNAASRLDVRFQRGARRVQMADGEAVFDVTHDPSRPFLIDTGDREVRVVGTEFNIRQRADAFALSVRRGLVEVRPSGAPDATPTRVPAGQGLSHRKGSAQAVIAAAEPEAAFAWTRGQLVYSAAPMNQVAADLSRSLGTPVQVADAATGRLRFSGVLALDDKDALLRRLEAFAPVRAERGAGGVVLHRR